MVLDFDVRRLPSRPTEWVALLEAVRAANPEDENLGIEWKGDIDLADNLVLARSVARTILGFANRSIEDARQYFGGHGVFLLGIEPGVVHGVARQDFADLDKRLGKYIGTTDGPRWSPTYYTVDDKDVLVIVVAPPQQGERIFALRTDFTDRTDPRKVRTTSAGSVWVRHLASADPAKQPDFDMLTKRAQESDGNLGLQVDVTCTPSEATVYSWHEESVENWIEGRRSILLQSIEDSKKPKTSSASGFRILTQVDAASFHSTAQEEDRTEDQFRDQVDYWVQQVRQAITEIPGVYGAFVGVAPRIEMHNPTEHNFREVKVRLHVAGRAETAEKSQDPPHGYFLFPEAPRKYGPWRKSTLPNYAAMRGISSSIANIRPLGPQTRRTNGGSFTIEPVPIDLRPYESVLVEDESVFLVPEDRTEQIVLEWTATATNVKGNAKGTIPLQRSNTLDPFGMFLRDRTT